MSLTAEEKTAVQETWAVVAKDLKGNSVQVFLNFFAMFPEYQKRFRGFADTPKEQLPENKRFKAHAFTVVSTINGMIDNLDDPELLCELLKKTGQNHSKRSLEIGDFKNLNDSLLCLFSKIFGEAWTPVAESGWKKVFSVILEKVGEGLKSTE